MSALGPEYCDVCRYGATGFCDERCDQRRSIFEWEARAHMSQRTANERREIAEARRRRARETFGAALCLCTVAVTLLIFGLPR